MTTPEAPFPPDDVQVRLRGPNPWLLLVVLGVACAGLGVWLLFSSRASQATVALLLAIALFLNGLSELVWAPDRRRPWVGGVVGAVFIIAGVVVLLRPGSGLKALAVVVGLALIVVGVFQAAAAVADRDVVRHWVWLVAFGLITAAFGFAAIVWPDVTIRVIGILIAIRLLVIGIGSIALGAMLREVPSGA